MKKILIITAILFIIGCFQSCGTLQKINKQAKEKALKIVQPPNPAIVYLRDTVWLARPPLTQGQIKAIFNVQLEKINKNQEIQANNDISRTEDLHKLAGVVDKLVEDSRTRTKNSERVLDNQSIFAKMYSGTMKEDSVYRNTIKNLQNQNLKKAKQDIENAKIIAAKSDDTTKSINILSGLMVIIALTLGIPQILLRSQTKAIKKEVLELQLKQPC